MNSKIKKLFGEICINCTELLYKNKEKNIIWEIAHNIYKRIFVFLNLSFFPIECIASYNKKYGNIDCVNLVENRKGVTSGYITINNKSEKKMEEISLPDIRLSQFENVLISGNSDVVLDISNGCIINDTCYNIEINIWFVDGLLYREKNNLGILRSNMEHVDKQISSGIMISGKFSYNYYHVLLENLIRVLLIEKYPIPKEIPILIDEKIAQIPSFKKIFEILSSELHRDYIPLSSDVIYKVNKLYYIDHINKLAPHCINMDFKYKYIYDPVLMKDYRDLLLKNKKIGMYPEKIFITRKNAKGRYFNEDEVYNVLKKYGFVKIAPEEYVFEEQMGLFNGAKWIVGGSGAAMTNLLFCSSNCNVICFRSSYIGEEPSLFNTLAYINGCNFWYMEPKSTSDPNSVHSDYVIDANELDSFLFPYFNN